MLGLIRLARFAPQGDDQLNYMIEVYYRALNHHESNDLEAAFKDSALRQEIVKGYSLNVDVIEKYVLIHRNRRAGKKKARVEDIGEFRQAMSGKDVAALKTIGIHVDKLASSKAI